MNEASFEVKWAIAFCFRRFTVGQLADTVELGYWDAKTIVQELLTENYITRVEPSLLEIQRGWGFVRQTYALTDDPEMRAKLYASIEAFELERDLQGIPIERKSK